MSSTLSILPAGFHEHTGHYASCRHKIIEKILNLFLQKGFESVCPPLVEYSKILFEEDRVGLENNSFRFVDNISGKGLAIRPDITLQILRIYKQKFKNAIKESSGPIKLCYQGDVCKLEADDFCANRQSLQAGIEILAEKNIEYDSQILQVMCEMLSLLGIEDYSVDIHIPCFLKYLLKGLKETFPTIISENKEMENKEMEKMLEEGFIYKDKEKIINVFNEYNKQFTQFRQENERVNCDDENCDNRYKENLLNEDVYNLIDLLLFPTTYDKMYDEDKKNLLQKLLSMDLSEELKGLFSNIFKLLDNLEKDGFAIFDKVTFNFFEVSKYSYHTDFRFVVYLEKKIPIIRGGRYESIGGVKGVGFTCDVDKLVQHIA